MVYVFFINIVCLTDLPCMMKVLNSKWVVMDFWMLKHYTVNIFGVTFLNKVLIMLLFIFDDWSHVSSYIWLADHIQISVYEYVFIVYKVLVFL